VAGPPDRTARSPRSAPREITELREIAERQPELADAAALHIEIAEMYRRIQGRVPLPWFELSRDTIARHSAEGRPLLRFEQIPIELTDLRLMVRQTADILRRHEALDESDYQQVQALGREMTLLASIGEWYRSVAERRAVAGVGEAALAGAAAPSLPSASVLDQVLAIAMRPFLSRCAEVLQQRGSLEDWTHPYCALCGAEPDFSVITPAAERHLICGRCTLQWKFEPLTCPYCRNSDRSRVTSFATPDGRYRVYGCDVCHRYLKAYDGRRATRPVMPVVDGVATLPLDAAAIQRGYS
jgi:hypothetical protein